MGNRPSFLAPLPLRANQLEAADAVCAALVTDDRATAVSACGTGKTLLGPEVFRRLGRRARFTVVFVPTLFLMAQTIQKWLQQRPDRLINYLSVCSDETVILGEDDATFDISSIACPVTTDAEEARRAIERAGKTGLVVFSTYQSAAVLARALPKGFSFGLGIFDEAHRTTGAGEERSFSLALHDTGIPIAKRFFMTATPRHILTRKSKGRRKQIVYSMDDESVYGKVVYRLTLREAIRRGLVCDYHIILACVDRRFGVDTHWLEKGEISLDGNGESTPELAALIALHKAMSELGAHKAITFHDRVITAGAFAAFCNAVPAAHTGASIPAFHVNGQMTVHERDTAIEGFRAAANAVATNVRCLAEGVDIPEVELIGLLSHRSSAIDIAQICGRALRLHPASGKTFGYIFVPVYLDLSNPDDIDKAVAGLEFADAVDAIHAMSALDDEVSTHVIGETGAQLFSRRKAQAIDNKIKLFAPPEIVERLRAAISVRVVTELSAAKGDLWESCFQELVAYKHEHGHLRIPRGYRTASGIALNTWISQQRTGHTHGNLGAASLKRLTDLGVDINARHWQSCYQALVEFKKLHGNLDIPKGYQFANGIDGDSWLKQQRTNAIHGALSKSKAEMLETLGFSLSRPESSWMKAVAELRMYVAREGNARVPPLHVTASGYPLGKWLLKVRDRVFKGRINEEKIAMLLDMDVDLQHRDDRWLRRYEAVVELAAKHKHLRIPRSLKTPGGGSLATWLTREIGVARRGGRSFSEARAAQILALPYLDTFLNRHDPSLYIEDAESFFEKYGHCRIDENTDPQWDLLRAIVPRWRTALRTGTIAHDMARRLEAIKFAEANLRPPRVSARRAAQIDNSANLRAQNEQRWNDRFAEVEAYKKMHGHTDFLPSDSSTRHLYDFLKKQRQQATRGKLSLERRGKLVALGVPYRATAAASKAERRWNESLDQLTLFKNEHGHLRVPSEGPDGRVTPLYSWLSNQRSRAAKLSESQRKKLKKLGLKI